MKKLFVRHSIKSVPLFFILSLLYFCSDVVFAQGETVPSESLYSEELVSLAVERRLYDDPYWHVLCHYRKNIFGYKSQVDDPRFFLDHNGKIDPQAEMSATIRAFFRKDQSAEDNAVRRFIARYSWLKDKLQIDESRMPDADRSGFYDLIKKQKPIGVTLVFPSGMISSPASMYGHTFLIVELEGKKRLMAGAINYLAITGEDVSLKYVVLGLLGGYPGYFSMMPYYEKVTEYADIEKRDVWEYTLDFTPEETQRLMMHLSELNNIYSNYYFLDENCSYNLLWLIEAGRPGLRLIDNLGVTVSPIDTIREIGQHRIIKDISFRPSKRTKIRYMTSQLSSKEVSLAFDIAEGNLKPDEITASVPDAQKQTRVLDLSVECLQILRTKDKVSSEQYGERFVSILKTRSTYGKVSETEESRITPSNPVDSHYPKKIEIGGGWRNGDGFFQEISLRPTYHGLLDRHEGYDFGEEIIFGSVRARYYDKDHVFKIQSFELLSFKSLQASSVMGYNTAWKIGTGLRQIPLSDGKDHLNGYFNTAGGYARDLPLIKRVYALAELEIIGSPELRYNCDAGAGVNIGMLNNITRWWTFHLYARSIYYVFSERSLYSSGTFEQRFSFSMNTALIIKGTVTRQHGINSKEAAASFELYF